MREKLAWEEIIKKYPNRWIALADYETRGSVILAGIPVRVCREREMYDTELELDKEGIRFMWARTTEVEGPMGVNVLYYFG